MSLSRFEELIPDAVHDVDRRAYRELPWINHGLWSRLAGLPRKYVLGVVSLLCSMDPGAWMGRPRSTAGWREGMPAGDTRVSVRSIFDGRLTTAQRYRGKKGSLSDWIRVWAESMIRFALCGQQAHGLNQTPVVRSAEAHVNLFGKPAFGGFDWGRRI